MISGGPFCRAIFAAILMPATFSLCQFLGLSLNKVVVSQVKSPAPP